MEVHLGGLKSSKPPFMTLPSEIRAIILRHVLGDRTIHVYYKLELQYEKGEITAKVSDLHGDQTEKFDK